MRYCKTQPTEIKTSNFYMNTILSKLKKTLKTKRKLHNKIKNQHEQFQVVVDTVCRALCVNVEDVFKKTRKQHIVEARHIIGFICRVECQITFVELGKKLKRDHSTIVHASQSIQNLMEYEEKTREKIVYLRKLCKEKINE